MAAGAILSLMHPPLPGTIGLSKIGGALGKAIRIGQASTGDLSPWTHAFVVVDSTRVIEARPGGAGYASLEHYMRPGEAIFLPGWPYLTDEQRARVPEVAESLVGIPYGYLDYVSLAAWRTLHLKLPLTRKRITSGGFMICSQMADALLSRLGVEVFDDGRESMDVTPGQLHLRWTEGLSQAAIEFGFPPVPPTPDPPEVHGQDLDEHTLPEPYASAPQAERIRHVHDLLQRPEEHR
jgi:hypothetical protein